MPIFFIAISREIDRDNVLGSKTICNISRWTTFSTFPVAISRNVIKGYLSGPHCEQLRFSLLTFMKQFFYWRDIIWLWTKLVLDLMVLLFFSAFISTEGALRRPLTYDDHPIPSPPLHWIGLRRHPDDLQWLLRPKKGEGCHQDLLIYWT